MRRPLSPLARLLLWDYARVHWAYVLLCLGMLLVLLVVPTQWWGDPMRGGR